jgi:hypothetical protein
MRYYPRNGGEVKGTAAQGIFLGKLGLVIRPEQGKFFLFCRMCPFV